MQIQLFNSIDHIRFGLLRRPDKAELIVPFDKVMIAEIESKLGKSDNALAASMEAASPSSKSGTKDAS